MMGAKFAVFILFLCLCGVMVNHALPSVEPEPGLRTIQEPLWPQRRSVDKFPGLRTIQEPLWPRQRSVDKFPGLRTIQEPLWPRRRSVDNLPQHTGPFGKRFEENDAINDKN